ncbi:hypothetical protein TSUD_00950 [Trifolium subterraneum]|nr:hypothetical protein TSUD_00950 [Trifolium subterraneum]
MALPCVTALNIENNIFPPTIKPPGSTNHFFLGGAGERGLQIQDKFVKFTAIAIYLQATAVPYLAHKWKGKSAHELTETVPFFRDIVTAIWKSLGIYTDEEAKAIEKFVAVFKDETFPPGSSILFTVSPEGLGSLTISFSKDGSIPEAATAVIENKLLSQAVLESMIGAHGVSPAAKQSLATRLSELFKEVGDANN